VSAINENASNEKSKKMEIEEDAAVKIMGALGETLARKILYFSTFEDMVFQMNGLNVSNLYGEGNEVTN
jgi:hypothetical protein